MTELFLAFLAGHDDAAWLRVIDRIAGAIHPVDRAATRIWFHFYPLALERAMARPDAAALARRMTLAGRWRLSDQIETSHRFLFGHRYWPAARRAVLEYAAGPESPSSLDLAAQIQEVAARAAAREGVPVAEMVGIAAVAMRTLQQVGVEALSASTAARMPEGAWAGLDADAVVRQRAARHRTRWWRGWTAGATRSFVIFDERQPDARFPIIHSQHLTTAAALDRRDHRSRDARCSEGPIPVHCRSCSCGTCWVGVIDGAEVLSPMERREREKLADCGIEVDEQTPIRLACMAQANGSVSIVIPPWNGLLRRVLCA